ncbi:hypothetical protein DFH09DRAFT_1073140 [Mycena vulgaris]|nr:hypothetical protein DFH09DRAFT_1073140 [Mycena vulgaris]
MPPQTPPPPRRRPAARSLHPVAPSRLKDAGTQRDTPATPHLHRSNGPTPPRPHQQGHPDTETLQTPRLEAATQGRRDARTPHSRTEQKRTEQITHLRSNRLQNLQLEHRDHHGSRKRTEVECALDLGEAEGVERVPEGGGVAGAHGRGLKVALLVMGDVVLQQRASAELERGLAVGERDGQVGNKRGKHKRCIFGGWLGVDVGVLRVTSKFA